MLDPPPVEQALSYDSLSRGLLSAAYKSIAAGPRLHVQNKTLAHALEFNKDTSWLPYFLGHTYVRSLHERLSRASSHFECPEHFVEVFLRILDTSSVRLLKSSASWDKPDRIEAIYNWLEILQHAPLERVRALTGLDANVDVLWFLQHGEVIKSYDPEAYDLAETLARLVPDPWRVFTQTLSTVDFDEIAAEHNDPPLGIDNRDMARRLVEGLVVGTGSLNLSTGGAAKLCGWIPRGFDTRHALAVRVQDAFWWLTLDDTELKKFPFDIDAIPKLPADIFERQDFQDHPTVSPALRINCFVTYTAYGLPRLDFYKPHVRYPQLLFVADCIYNQSGLQSAHFSDHINCIYRRAQDRIICH